MFYAVSSLDSVDINVAVRKGPANLLTPNIQITPAITGTSLCMNREKDEMAKNHLLQVLLKILSNNLPVNASS